MEQNDGCAIQKRYMSLESPVGMSENPAVGLPAASALAWPTRTGSAKMQVDFLHHVWDTTEAKGKT